MSKYLFRISLIIIALVLVTKIIGEDSPKQFEKKEPDFLTESTWVDSVFSSLTVEEKIAQLFMLPAYSNRNESHVKEVDSLILKYGIGGLIFFQGSPVRQAEMTNHFQKISKVPLLVAIDGEWGLGMRLDSTTGFPRQMMLGAIQNNQLIYEMGAEIARQCRRLGIHMNFAPVVDVNNNPRNPVINSRSFGEDRENVAAKGYSYMLGLQDNRVIATAKHFPGHGDTDSDSHKTLPIIKHGVKRLDSIELYPFKRLINSGLGAVMVAHLHIPSLDSTNQIASSLSPKVVAGLLKDSLGFKGLVVTDALGMAGARQTAGSENVELQALLAGNDILLMPKELPTAIGAILEALKAGRISEETINQRCKKVLQAKYWVGLNNYKPVKTSNLTADLNKGNDLLKRKLVENSITLLTNKDSLLPFLRLDTLDIASVSIGSRKVNRFQKYLGLYSHVKFYAIRKNSSPSLFEALVEVLSKHEVVVVSVHNTNRSPRRNFGISRQTIDFVRQLSKKTKVVLNVFANPYSLNLFQNLKDLQAVLLSYEDNELTREVTAQVLFGAIPSVGRLPVSIDNQFFMGEGINADKILRLKYSLPGEIKMDEKILRQIDTLAELGIKKRAYPGCQILVAKNGVVVYRKSFGYHSYRKKRAVSNDDIYDLASITKMAATVAALMKLSDDKLFSVNEKLVKYLPELAATNKKKLRIRDILTHQARLKPWIPFYVGSFLKGTKKLNPQFYQTTYSDTFSVQVAKHLFIKPAYADTIFSEILSSKLRKRKKYRYSDLGFYLFREVVERLSKQELDRFVTSYFYERMGANTLCFKPLDKFERNRIVPTENDNYFRNQIIQGYVHDPGAAMLGGVSGHAGLFGNANDLAKLMQMYLQKGTYGSIQYLKPETIELFTSCPFCKKDNRRGLGFDKPVLSKDANGATCKSVSKASFGHTGFTGTIAWADPKNNLVYIFLSNRTYPNASNRKLIDMDLRPRIQQVIYDAIQ